MQVGGAEAGGGARGGGVKARLTWGFSQSARVLVLASTARTEQAEELMCAVGCRPPCSCQCHKTSTGFIRRGGVLALPTCLSTRLAHEERGRGGGRGKKKGTEGGWANQRLDRLMGGFVNEAGAGCRGKEVK